MNYRGFNVHICGTSYACLYTHELGTHGQTCLILTSLTPHSGEKDEINVPMAHSVFRDGDTTPFPHSQASFVGKKVSFYSKDGYKSSHIAPAFGCKDLTGTQTLTFFVTNFNITSLANVGFK